VRTGLSIALALTVDPPPTAAQPVRTQTSGRPHVLIQDSPCSAVNNSSVICENVTFVLNRIRFDHDVAATKFVRDAIATAVAGTDLRIDEIESRLLASRDALDDVVKVFQYLERRQVTGAHEVRLLKQKIASLVTRHEMSVQAQNDFRHLLGTALDPFLVPPIITLGGFTLSGVLLLTSAVFLTCAIVKDGQGQARREDLGPHGNTPEQEEEIRTMVSGFLAFGSLGVVFLAASAVFAIWFTRWDDPSSKELATVQRRLSSPASWGVRVDGLHLKLSF